MPELPIAPASAAADASFPENESVSSPPSPPPAEPPVPERIHLEEPADGWPTVEDECLAMLVEARGTRIADELLGLVMYLDRESRRYLAVLDDPRTSATLKQTFLHVAEKLTERDRRFAQLLKVRELLGTAAGDAPPAPQDAATVIQEAMVSAKSRDLGTALRNLVGEFSRDLASRLALVGENVARIRSMAPTGYGDSTTHQHYGPNPLVSWMQHAGEALALQRHYRDLTGRLEGAGSEATERASQAATAAIAAAGGPGKVASMVADSRRLRKQWYETSPQGAELAKVEAELSQVSADLSVLTTDSAYRGELTTRQRQLADRRSSLRADIDRTAGEAVNAVLDQAAAGSTAARAELVADIDATPAVFPAGLGDALRAVDLDPVQVVAVLDVVSYETELQSTNEGRILHAGLTRR